MNTDLDAMLCQMFARRAPVEETLLAVASGKRDLLTREECKALAVRLGVPAAPAPAISGETQPPERIRVAQDAEGFWTCREARIGSQEYVRADLAAPAISGGEIVSVPRSILTSARETILGLVNARNSEAEGTDEEWVGDIDAALAIADDHPPAPAISGGESEERFDGPWTAYCEENMVAGCCSAIRPCAHQRGDPFSICDACKRAAAAPKREETALDMCLSLPLIEDRLRRCGLLETARKMNEVVRAAGYETERLLKQREMARRKQERAGAARSAKP